MQTKHLAKAGLSTLFLTALIVFSAALQAADEPVKRLSEPVASTDSYEDFGTPLPEGGSAVSLGELIGNHEQYQGQEVLLETRIAKVCQKKGCFFVATEGADSARVTFKDYGFFIPTDSGGKNVKLAGTFSRKAVTSKEAEHYAEDLGEKAPANPEKFEYSVVASSVRIPRS